MSTVTIRNYSFPIYFSYKGWSVKITDETGFFSMKDLKVRVKMEVDYEEICSKIAQTAVQVAKLKYDFMRRSNPFLHLPQDSEIYQNEYNRIVKSAKEFANRKGVVEYSIASNGGMMDRFFGQNISAVEKMCQQVVERIDKTYGDVLNEFLQTLK